MVVLVGNDLGGTMVILAPSWTVTYAEPETRDIVFGGADVTEDGSGVDTCCPGSGAKAKCWL